MKPPGIRGFRVLRANGRWLRALSEVAGGKETAHSSSLYPKPLPVRPRTKAVFVRLRQGQNTHFSLTHRRFHLRSTFAISIQLSINPLPPNYSVFLNITSEFLTEFEAVGWRARSKTEIYKQFTIMHLRLLKFSFASAFLGWHRPCE